MTRTDGHAPGNPTLLVLQSITRQSRDDKPSLAMTHMGRHNAHSRDDACLTSSRTLMEYFVLSLNNMALYKFCILLLLLLLL